MSNPSPITKLAELTAGNDLTGDFQRDEEIRRAEAQPAPQQPMLQTATPEPVTSAAGNYRKLVQDNGDEAPTLSDEVTAALLFAGMHATWGGNFWVLKFRDGRTITKRVGGRVVSRDRTGVSAKAGLAEWMTEINSLAMEKVFGPGGHNDGTTV